MPSIDLYKKTMQRFGTTIGQAHKNNSDLAMEMTWANDIQSKVCYIYDYAHDDQPDKCCGMTYEDTTKYAIDTKFIITQYGTLSKDQVEYHIQFRPSQPLFFGNTDELYYYETEYRQKYGTMTFPISLYLDIPDDNGLYHKWIICSKEIGNQFIKYSVLPCNYRYQWIVQENNNRIKYQMWGVDRQQLNYSSGVWRNYNFEMGNNVEKILLPLNPVTESIYYTDDNENMRMIISAKVKQPNTWRVTKVENTKPPGLLSVTVEQTPFNPHTDYLEINENGDIVGMWADYYKGTTPIEIPSAETSSIRCVVSASTNNIKIGGSYRTLRARLFNKNNEDITAEYIIGASNWKCYLNNEDITDSSDVTWSKQENNGEIKVKLANNRSYLDESLKFVCTVDDIRGEAIVIVVS